MKLSTALSLFGLALGATTFAIAQGCSSDSTDGGGGGGQTGKVPPAAEGPPTTSTDERTFALHTLQLGEADRGGTKNKDAWKKYGYNLDNRITNVTSAQSEDLKSVCKRAQGAQATIHQDGDEGIDNSFGKTILTLLEPFTATPSKSLDEAIQKGDFTILLSIKGLTDDGSQTNTGLSGTLRVGGEFGPNDAKPTFTTADDWPFLKEPQVPINGAYINKGVFVNGTGGASINLALSISGQTLSLTINKAIVTFKHNPAGKEITEGTIAGVINTEQFVTGIGSIAGRFDKSLCSGSTVEGIKQSIRQASDMMADGSQNPSADCTGISIGLGFTGKQVANPTKTAPDSTPPPDPCKDTGDAGSDASTNDSGGSDSGDASDQ